MQTDNATSSSHRCKHARVRRNWLSEASDGVGRAQTVMLDKLELSENCFTRYRKSCGVKLRVYCLEVLIAEKQMNGGLIDVTIVDQTGVDLNAASHTAGVAVMRKAEEKLNKYEGKFPPSYTLIPLALEQTGRSCPHTSRFVRAAAEHESSACEGAYTVSACISRWRQRISVVLQRSISESVLRSFRKTRVDPAVGTAPATQLHRLVSLLVLPSATPAETDVIDTG